ncbi:MAG: hypothetical protein ACLFQX_06730, partial [Candidatus Kapaibacterium sp.]
MLLAETALKIIFLNSVLVEPLATDLDEAVEQYEQLLPVTQNSEELLYIIGLDNYLYLPIELMLDTFERCMKLNRSNPDVLLKYAEYINIYLPELNEYAEKLIR